MARPVYSTSLILGTLTLDVGAEFIIEEGLTLVLRDITFTALNPGADAGSLLVTLGGVQLATWWFPPGFSGTEHIELRGVLPGPSILAASVTGSECLAETAISGYVLTP